MRPRLIDFLNDYFGVSFFNYAIPDPAVVYAIMLGLGLWLYIRRCGKQGLNQYHASGLAIWVSVAGLVGARLFYLIQNLGYVVDHPKLLWELNGATVSWGVYLGGLLGALAYLRIQKIQPWDYLDVAGSVIGIGPMLGRWACFLNGDDYGTRTDLPWGVRYPHGSYPFINHVRNEWITPLDHLSLAVHPVQLYESAAGLGLLVGFSVLWKSQILKPGALFGLFWMAYACCRFTIEFFRGDDERGFVGPLSTGQFMGIAMFLGAAAFIWWRYRWHIRKDVALT
jgi:phosphatidylglycerol:prolipoprotein diacylglycerol transferase